MLLAWAVSIGLYIAALASAPLRCSRKNPAFPAYEKGTNAVFGQVVVWPEIACSTQPLTRSYWSRT